ncbi:hypothetical protein ACP2AV_06520 [Aliiroseovarius sp. PTFE2010]|uniref:hypothetical protein n=1 Tax=Aliiroseovarius sp. PTFE2010 TaxID=3417190 RepID=UPI003CFB3B14
MNWLSFLTAFGMGSVVTALVQAWLAQRSQKDERSFREKQEAYIGLLVAYRRAAVVGTDEAAKVEATNEAAKNFAYWQFRCELVAPIAVRQAIIRIVETNDDQIARS